LVLLLQLPAQLVIIAPQVPPLKRSAPLANTILHQHSHLVSVAQVDSIKPMWGRRTVIFALRYMKYAYMDISTLLPLSLFSIAL